MPPTRMKLRRRRRDNASATEGDGAQEAEPRRRREGRGRRRNTNREAATWSPPSSARPDRAEEEVPAVETSPDSKCPICLDRFNNLAYLDRCLHRFCFPCIQEWSHNKAECPLCKQPFASILHSVRAEDDFKEYVLQPQESVQSTLMSVVAALASASRNHRNMRLMLRQHRAAYGAEASSWRRERRGRGWRRAEERATVWQLYMNSLPSETPHESLLRGALQRGVVFEGLTGPEGTVPPASMNDRVSRRLMMRLAARQRLQRKGTLRPLIQREVLWLRRGLYRCGIRVRGVAGATDNQQRDVTADSFRQSPALLSRLRPWLQRELTVLYGDQNELVEIVLIVILHQLENHGLEEPAVMEEELRWLLLARTEHFVHELLSFARSPLDMEDYDMQAVYDPHPTFDLEWVSSSSDSSVITVSDNEEAEREEPRMEEEREEPRMEVEGEEPEGLDELHNDINQISSNLSQSGWDDETPGPSYSTADQCCSLAPLRESPAPSETANQEAGEEECLIVGYKKPIAERTPELVQLSSDSEKEEPKEATPPAAATPSAVATPLHFLNAISPSTSAAFRDEPKENAVQAAKRSRSWSCSSERSRNSVSSLSPSITPGGERRSDGVSWRERRRRSRERRTRRRSGSGESSTFHNTMRHRSRSPLRSSGESSGALLSDTASIWEPPSSDSSPSCSLSSSLRCSLLRLRPLPPASPAGCHDGHHVEKPGGKRKYKSRHLDSDKKDPTWQPRERSRKRRRCGADGTRKSRQERSPSVEIVYEGTAHSKPASARRMGRRRMQRKRPPVIITLDSDSSHDDGQQPECSNSPTGSRHTAGLPPLPFVCSDAVGGALEAGTELPVQILARELDVSEAEPVTWFPAESGMQHEDARVHAAPSDGRRSPLAREEETDSNRNAAMTSQKVIRACLKSLAGQHPPPSSLPPAPPLKRRWDDGDTQTLQEEVPLPKRKDGSGPSPRAERSGPAAMVPLRDNVTIPPFCTLRHKPDGAAAGHQVAPPSGDGEEEEEEPRCRTNLP